MALKPDMCSFDLIWEYCSQVEIALLRTTSPGDTHMQMRHLDYFIYFRHVLTVLVLHLLFTRSSSAAHHVVKDINEISLNSIFAPYGFAEAVAPLKQSVVPSGHCGFCPSLAHPPTTHPPPFSLSLTAAACRPSLESSLTKHPEGASR